MDRDCSLVLAVPASSSLCALGGVAPAVAVLGASASAAVNNLQRYLLEHHSCLPCSATMCMSCSMKDTQWTTLDNLVSHSFSLLPYPSPTVPRPLQPSCCHRSHQPLQEWDLWQVCPSHRACSVTGGQQPPHLLPDRQQWGGADWAGEGRGRWRG